MQYGSEGHAQSILCKIHGHDVAGLGDWHLDDLSVDEFHTIFGAENTGFSHLIVLVHREKLLCNLDLHMKVSFDCMIPQSPGAHAVHCPK